MLAQWLPKTPVYNRTLDEMQLRFLLSASRRCARRIKKVLRHPQVAPLQSHDLSFVSWRCVHRLLFPNFIPIQIATPQLFVPLVRTFRGFHNMRYSSFIDTLNRELA